MYWTLYLHCSVCLKYFSKRSQQSKDSLLFLLFCSPTLKPPHSANIYEESMIRMNFWPGRSVWSFDEASEWNTISNYQPVRHPPASLAHWLCFRHRPSISSSRYSKWVFIFLRKNRTKRYPQRKHVWLLLSFADQVTPFESLFLTAPESSGTATAQIILPFLDQTHFLVSSFLLPSSFFLSLAQPSCISCKFFIDLASIHLLSWS